MNKASIKTNWNAFIQLFLMNYRELVRDRTTFFFVLVFPFMFIALFAFISYQSQPAPIKVGIVMASGSDAKVQSLTEQLRQHDRFQVSNAEEAELNAKFAKKELDAAVVLPRTLDAQGSVRLVYDRNKEDLVLILKSLLYDQLHPTGGPQMVTEPIGDARKPFDILKFTFPSVLILAFLSLSLTGTSVPIIQMRQRGSLRLFALTPVNRFNLVASQILVRAVIAMIQVAIMLVYSFQTGIVTAESVPGILMVSGFGLLMFFSLGYMLGGMLRSQEAVNGVIGLIMGPLMIVCGLFYPLEWMPPLIRTFSQYVPLTYFGDGLRKFVNTGTEAMASLFVDCLVMTSTAALFLVIALYTFQWDDRSDQERGRRKDARKNAKKLFRIGG
ncbi:ABC transporter permease [Paenibacillus sp. A3]|uniref:ABC transporter permease n=1 Tax=Paenibacillus sp. A3 TaxID=1337054 RepID=UPI0006D55B77|nr:ABC transporter permease [Paenibacillus sp. A3]